MLDDVFWRNNVRFGPLQRRFRRDMKLSCTDYIEDQPASEDETRLERSLL